MGKIPPPQLYLVVTGEHFGWVGIFLDQHLFENIAFGEYSVLVNLSQFTHFGEHYRPAILVLGTPLRFSQLCADMRLYIFNVCVCVCFFSCIWQKYIFAMFKKDGGWRVGGLTSRPLRSGHYSHTFSYDTQSNIFI